MTLYVGTRKGLFRFDQKGDHWQQTAEWFLGDSVPMLLPDARDNTLYAAVEHGHFGTKLHRCDNADGLGRNAQGGDNTRAHDGDDTHAKDGDDAGNDWQELDPPIYPTKPDDVPDTLCPIRQIPIPWSLEKIWSMETGGADQPGVLWCGTLPGGLFKSTDRGASWTLNRALWDRPERSKWAGGGYDFPGIHSIAVNPQDSNDIVIAISCGGVWRSRDGGNSWTQCAHGMFYDFDPDAPEDDPDGQDPHLLVRCAAQPEAMWSQHHCGIFRWQAKAESWSRIEGVKPSGFGFAAAVHPKNPEIAWFVPAVKDEFRFPVDGRLVVTRTRDGGRSFESLTSGLPEGKAYDLIYRHCLAVDDSGENLAMASTTGSLWVSSNGGDDWQLLSHHLPPVYCVRFASMG